MLKTGIKIDVDQIKNLSEIYHKELDELTTKIYSLAGEEFNINSTKQLGVLLFEKLGLKGGKKTKTGYSTAADVLEKLKGESELVERIFGTAFSGCENLTTVNFPNVLTVAAGVFKRYILHSEQHNQDDKSGI